MILILFLLKKKKTAWFLSGKTWRIIPLEEQIEDSRLKIFESDGETISIFFLIFFLDIYPGDLMVAELAAIQLWFKRPEKDPLVNYYETEKAKRLD